MLSAPDPSPTGEAETPVGVAPSGPGVEEMVTEEMESGMAVEEDEVDVIQVPDDLAPLDSFEDTESMLSVCTRSCDPGGSLLGGCRAALLPVIEGAEELASLNAAVARSDLGELLMDDATEATLFAPTNEVNAFIFHKIQNPSF